MTDPVGLDTAESSEPATSPEPARVTRTTRPARSVRVALSPAALVRAHRRAASTVIGIFTVIMFLRLRPDLLLSTTTPTGGDNGAHIWTADYARRELLPHLRLTGWSNDWYSGLPVLGFYFPAPTWLIVALSFVLPYGIAYKLVTVIGILSLPALCYLWGRRAEIHTTNAMALGLAAFPFLIARHFRILGGNIMSTMAGEFSFSISLSLVVLYAGLLLVLLRTGRGAARTAVVLAVAGLSHIVPTIFALLFTVGAVVSYGERGRWRRQLRDVAAVGAVGAALASFWLVPFGANLAYTNSMDYEKNRKFLKTLFPFFPNSATLHTPTDGTLIACIALVLAAVAVAIGLRRRDRFIRALTITMVLCGIAFCVAPQGAMWNNRLVPLWFFCAYLLGGQGVVVLGRIVFGWRRPRAGAEESVPAARVRRPARAALVGGLVTYAIAGPAFGMFPGFVPVPTLSGGHLSVGRISDTSDFKKAGMPFGWAISNEDGAEHKSGWTEYRQLIDTLKKLPPGRSLWEYEKAMGRYGTPMALMAIPYWTKSRIQSSEGLYFEASPTTPFHFVTASMVTAAPSNPQRRLPYKSFDLTTGIDRMRRLGIRYYIAFSKKATTAAAIDRRLVRVAESKPFVIYEIVDHAIVEPLRTEPVVATGIAGSLDGGFIDAGLAAWTDPTKYPETIALNGPAEWPRSRVTVKRVASSPGRATTRGTGVKLGTATHAARLLPVAAVSRVVVTNQRVSFHVDRVGVPVLVRISAFPNWQAQGAKGPYRVNPNFMVVVPTAHDVSLNYGYSNPDKLGWTFTFLGLGGVVVLRRRGRRLAPADQSAD